MTKDLPSFFCWVGQIANTNVLVGVVFQLGRVASRFTRIVTRCQNGGNHCTASLMNVQSSSTQKPALCQAS